MTRTRNILLAVPTLIVVGVAAFVLVSLGTRDRVPAVTAASPAYDLVRLPEGLDTLSTLAEVERRVEACSGECVEVVYLWSPRMPLSRSGIPNAHQATRRTGARLTVVGFEELEGLSDADDPSAGSLTPVAERMLAAGALSHAPSLVLFAGGELLGPAIMGYKTAEAYEWMIERRLADGVAGTEETVRVAAAGAVVSPEADSGEPAATDFAYRDYEAIGVPGAYFRWIPGRRAVAYESGRRIYLLDLDDGRNLLAPGTIDFVPTPDGRYFVTPGPSDVGLAFFDADEVFEGARGGSPGGVRPIFTDDRMRDQYPSVGILASQESTVLYRVLTSWFEGVVYRDYEVVHGEGGRAATVRPLGAPVVPCEGAELSTPIMAQDGSEVAARDEATGTTKIFRFLPGGRCEQVVDLGMPTRKVAWHASGRKLAFSTPRVRSSSGGFEPRIFVYDRDSGDLTGVSDSEGASQLAFPDFVGDDALVFMLPGRVYGEPSRFRVVEPIP